MTVLFLHGMMRHFWPSPEKRRPKKNDGDAQNDAKIFCTVRLLDIALDIALEFNLNEAEFFNLYVDSPLPRIPQ